MKLYYSDVLSPRRACAVARYLKSPVEFVYLDLGKGEQKAPAFLALNPNGKVPTLAWVGGSLWEADAIMCKLARDAGSELWPGDERQVDVIRWLSWNALHFYPHGGTLYFEHVIKPRFDRGPPEAAVVDAGIEAFRKAAGILEGHLDGRRWLVGDGPTVADFSTAVTLPYAERSRMPLQDFPAIRRWHDRLNEFEAWREPFPQTAMAA
jgi:glutathione S-transferase